MAGVDELDVVFGTSTADVLAQLPATTVLTDDQGDTYNVELRWVLYDFTANNPVIAPGRFIVSGLFTLPEGVARGDIRTQVDTFINVGPGLASIRPVEGFRVGLGSSVTEAAAGLPSKVRITDSLGERYDVKVTWIYPADYSPTAVAASFNFVGSIELPTGIGAGTQVPASISVPVTINETALPISTYRWTLMGDVDRFIADEPQTISIRIQTLALGLEGAGKVDFEFGLNDSYLAPGIEDVLFVIDGEEFINFGSIELDLARNEDLTIEVTILVSNPQAKVALDFAIEDVELELSNPYSFDVISKSNK